MKLSPEEQKEKIKEYDKRRYQNRTEEQKNKTITLPLKQTPPIIPLSQKSPQYRKIPTSL